MSSLIAFFSYGWSLRLKTDPKILTALWVAIIRPKMTYDTKIILKSTKVIAQTVEITIKEAKANILVDLFIFNNSQNQDFLQTYSINHKNILFEKNNQIMQSETGPSI